MSIQIINESFEFIQTSLLNLFSEECQKYTESQLDALAITNLIASTLSIFGASFVLINVIFASDRPTYMILIFNLAFADLLFSLFTMISQAILLVKTYSIFICYFLRCLIQVGAVASFLWTGCIALYLFKELLNTSKVNQKKLLIGFHVIAWIPPIISVIIIASTGGITRADSGYCTTTVIAGLITWDIPLIFSFIWNLIFYVASILKLRQKRFALVQQSSLGLCLSLFILSFLICWSFDIVSHFYYDITGCGVFWLSVVKDLLAPLQGFINCIVYTFFPMGNEIRRRFKKIYVLIFIFLLSPILLFPSLIWFTYFNLRDAIANFSKSKNYMNYNTFDEEPVNLSICDNGLPSQNSIHLRDAISTTKININNSEMPNYPSKIPDSL
eukprot:TRINITY_DN278_c1_g1_i1.p1 TRINITY_DN278_c1_g1~~TRINITY_DN278_c1_g1_i1.p1  ORF type:complete len:393 (+),score=120.61 TRINITY_DN278_c1_g1_i1:24-1181(+)